MAKSNVLLKGRADEKRPDMVKITMVFYKPGLNRVPKVLKITGPLKHWDAKTQRFRPKTEGAAENNALLAAEVSKFQRLANEWEAQGVRWTLKDLSHYFDKPRQMMLRETVIPTVEQVYLAWIEETKNTVKMKNGHEVSCEPYADSNRRYMNYLARFVKEKYGRSFRSLVFGGDVNNTLRRIVALLGYDEEITWYSARGTYITMMIDKGYRPEAVAEHSGNSVRVIYKDYYKNTRENDIIADMCREFA